MLLGYENCQRYYVLDGIEYMQRDFDALDTPTLTRIQAECMRAMKSGDFTDEDTYVEGTARELLIERQAPYEGYGC